MVLITCSPTRRSTSWPLLLCIFTGTPCCSNAINWHPTYQCTNRPVDLGINRHILIHSMANTFWYRMVGFLQHVAVAWASSEKIADNARM